MVEPNNDSDSTENSHLSTALGLFGNADTYTPSTDTSSSSIVNHNDNKTIMKSVSNNPTEYLRLSTNPLGTRSAILSRQSSFDHGGEGRLSSTQVKQRLKAHVLSRRRSTQTGIDQSRVNDINFPNPTSSSSDLSAIDRLAYRRSAFQWHSADLSTGEGVLQKSLPLQRSLDLPVFDHSTPSRRASATDTPNSFRPVAVGLHRQPSITKANTLSIPTDTPAQDVNNSATNDQLLIQLQLAAHLQRTLSQSDLTELSLQHPLVRNLLDKLTSPPTPGASHLLNPSMDSNTNSLDARVEEKEVPMEWEHIYPRSYSVLGRTPASSADTSVPGCSRTQSAPTDSEHTNWFDDLLDRWSRFPVDDWTDQRSSELNQSDVIGTRTAIAFDPDMLQHRCLCSTAHDVGTHPECPERLRAVLEQLSSATLNVPKRMSGKADDLVELLLRLNPQHACVLRQWKEWNQLEPSYLRTLLSRLPLIAFCQLIRARMASDSELQLFHSEAHVATFGGGLDTISSDSHSSVSSSSILSPLVSAMEEERLSRRFCKLQCGGLAVDSDTVWNPKTTARAARLAVGQVICLTHKVASNQLRNGFALIRPPGHHAEPDHAMGFCYFNSVAVAALHLARHYPTQRLLLLDWDIHHGNGTKAAALKHPNAVYVSIHRFNGGTFFPGTGPIKDHHPMDFPTNRRSIAQRVGVIPESMIRSSGSGAQLINIAWETPSPDGYSSSPLAAGDRREMWRQFHSRRNRLNHRLAGDQSNSVDTSVTSDYASFSGAGESSDLSYLEANRRLSVGNTAGVDSMRHVSTPSSLGSSILSGAGSLTSNQTSDTSDKPNDSNSFRPPRPHLGLGDAEYLAAMRCCVIPIAREFRPDIILVSCGFDAAAGHAEALGGYSVSSGLFAWITRQVKSIFGKLSGLSGLKKTISQKRSVGPFPASTTANGRVILALEGGYNPTVVSECTFACLNSLLLPSPTKPWIPHLTTIDSPVSPSIQWDPDAYVDVAESAVDWISPIELNRPPCPEAVATLFATMRHQSGNGWRCLQNAVKENAALSFAEAMQLERKVSERQTKGSATTATPSSPSSPLAGRDLEVQAHNSPLTHSLAQLHMDQD